MDPSAKDNSPRTGMPNASGPQSLGAERTYQMLWDCPHCATRKNLGLSHRHCPNCGAPQDASWRYFPADDEKVAVEDHQYAGADLKCDYCGSFSGRRCRCCVNCGAPLEGARAVRTRQEQLTAGRYAGETQNDARQELRPPNAPVAAAPKKPGGKWLASVLGVAVLVVAIGLVFGWFKRDADLRVTGHSWKREIAIERFDLTEESDWCDKMPSGATDVRRSRKVRSEREVADGQECRTRRKDRGDGTYTEQQECAPRTKKEPVYDDQCRYKIAKWSRVRSEERSGHSLEQQPSWPDVRLTRSGECMGCEREGAREEQYTVEFASAGDDKPLTCQVDQNRWASLSVGSTWRGKVGLVGSSVDCSELERL